MKVNELFIFKLGTAVNAMKAPTDKLVVVERLFVEFLDVNKPRRIMYACKDFTNGGTVLHPQQTLELWHENRKIPQKHKESKNGGKASRIHLPSSMS